LILYFRIDSHKACKVRVNVTSFLMVEDGRSVYHKGRLLEWWVAVEEYSIIEMEKDVLEHYSWANNQEALFWYDGHDGKTIRLATDQELLNLLRSSEEVTFIMIVGRSDHLVANDNEPQIVVRNEFLAVRSGQRNQNMASQQLVLIEQKRKRKSTIWILVLTQKEMTQLKQMKNGDILRSNQNL
jgi:hypothetical protein